MTLIKITRGSYGLYENNTVVAKTSKDEPFEVSSSEAERLLKLEVAEIVKGITQNPVLTDENRNDDELLYNKSMNMAALSQIALKFGIDETLLKECKTKQQIIDLIDEKKKADEEDIGEKPNFGNDDGVVG